MKNIIFLLLITSFISCRFYYSQDETPWCTLPVKLDSGFLYPNGVIEKKEKGKTTRKYLEIQREGYSLGIAIGKLNNEQIIVVDVVPGGPAAKAGIRQGDLIITKEKNLTKIISKWKENRSKIKIKRGNKIKDLILVPEPGIPGRCEFSIPLIISFSGDISLFSLTFGPSLFEIFHNWYEKEPGTFGKKTYISFLFGLINLKLVDK